MSSETLKSKAVGKVWRLTKPGHFEVEEVAIPKPTAEQVLVDVKSVGVCGTDIHGSMGILGTPLVLGHDGEVVWKGKRFTVDPALVCRRCEECLSDRSYACAQYRFLGMNTDGLFATQVLLPERSLHELPENFPENAATVLEPIAVALRVKDRIPSSDRVTIIGAGPMGLVIGLLLSKSGMEISLVEPKANRRAFAQSWGLHAEESTSYQDHLYIETSANDLATKHLLEAAPAGSTICMVGAPATEYSMRNLLLKDFSIIGMRGGAGRYRAAIALVQAGVIPVADLVTHTFDNPIDAVTQVRDHGDEIIRAVINF